jgi:hypothetical protein
MNRLRISIAAAVIIIRALLITDLLSSEARGWAQIALIVSNIAAWCLPRLEVAQHHRERRRRKKLRKSV